MGAVIGTLFAEGSIPVTQFIMLRKEIPYRQLIRKTIPTVVSGILMYLIVKAVSLVNLSQGVLLIFEIGVGILSYIIIVLTYLSFLEREVVIKIFKMIKHKS